MSYLQVSFWSEGEDGIDVIVSTPVIPRVGETVFWEGSRYKVGSIAYEYQGNRPNVCTIAVVELVPVRES